MKLEVQSPVGRGVDVWKRMISIMQVLSIA